MNAEIIVTYDCSGNRVEDAAYECVKCGWTFRALEASKCPECKCEEVTRVTEYEP